LNKTRNNIGANYAGQFWSAISVFLFVPFYLKFLGIESYGLVGFYITLMGVLAFADIGLTATLNREMARLSVHKDSDVELCDLLRTYEFVYACISFLIILSVWFMAPLIANHWLQSEILEPNELTFIIQLMGVAIALQLPANLYIGGLMGLQKQVLTNSIQIGWSMFRGIGSILVLWLISPTILAFIWWQLISNIIYYLFARTAIWRVISSNFVRPRFKWLVFQNTWRYAMGMTGMTFVSIMLLQTDKLVVSKMLTLEMFGYYMLAVTFASIPSVLGGPIVRAVFPRLTKLVELGDRDGFVRLYHRTSELVSVAIIPAALTGILFAGDFIFIWTGSAEASMQAGLVASLLLAGTLMQSIMVVPFYVALAHGDVKLNLKVGSVSIVLLVPLLLFLIPKYNILGAGISWLTMNSIILFPYMYFIHRKFLSGQLLRWCLWSVGRPLLFSLPILLLGRWLIPHSDSRLLMFFIIGFTWSLAFIVTVISIPNLRHTGINFFYRLFGAPHDGK
jgi:O-antigen/teichoic acid export membrane protein